MGSRTEKVAIVTGASNGIGRAIAERLTQDGATVVVNYGKSAEKAKAVVAGIEAKGSKAALEQFTKGLAHELASRRVTVNTVSPGFTETAMLPDALRDTGAQMSPFKRIGTPQDIADVVAFVVSEGARWLTGQNIHAGGGAVM